MTKAQHWNRLQDNSIVTMVLEDMMDLVEDEEQDILLEQWSYHEELHK
jgi:hypothetical protein